MSGVLLEECSPIAVLMVARQKRSPPSGYGRKDLFGNNLKHERNSDAAFFWIPAFAGMTSCPPFDFAQDRLRRASSIRAVWETHCGPCSGSERMMRSLHLVD